MGHFLCTNINRLRASLVQKKMLIPPSPSRNHQSRGLTRGPTTPKIAVKPSKKNSIFKNKKKEKFCGPLGGQAQKKRVGD
jgi:hypothetical protein